MATSINSYSVSLGMDASGLIDASRLSRAEARSLIREIESARTPLENYALEYDKLEKAYQSGAIQLGVYERLLNKAKDKYGLNAAEIAKATAEQKRYNDMMQEGSKLIEQHQSPMARYQQRQEHLNALHKAGAIDAGTHSRAMKQATGEYRSSEIASFATALHPVGIAFGIVSGAALAAGAATVSFVSTMRDAQNAIDDTADAAERLGISYSDLQGLQFGFKEGGGVDAQTVSDSIKKMQINLAKAVDGDEGLREAFNKLGVDAGELIGKGPREAMMSIADAMQGVDNHAERLKLSMDIFGKSGADLASTLGKGRDALEESAVFAEKWLGLTDAQVAAVGSNNDAWDRISTVVTGITNNVAAELAPAFEIVATTILDSVGEADGLKQGIESAVTVTTQLVAGFMDTLDVIGEVAKRWYALQSGDFAGLTKPLDDAVLSFDKLKSAVEQLENNRQAAREAAESAEQRRQEQRQARVMEELDSEIKKKADASKKLEQEQKRAREQAEREQEKSFQDALKNAQRYFEEERKRQMKMREDVARGPGAGMEADSADAAKFMAQQANSLIAEATVSLDAKPTDQQLVEQAKLQLEIMRQDQAKQAEIVSKIKEMTQAIQDNGWEAV